MQACGQTRPQGPCQGLCWGSWWQLLERSFLWVTLPPQVQPGLLVALVAATGSFVCMWLRGEAFFGYSPKVFPHRCSQACQQCMWQPEEASCAGGKLMIPLVIPAPALKSKFQSTYQFE